MELITANIPKTCDIVIHGDSHEGNAMTATDKVQEVIDWTLAKRNRYMVHMGDAIEAIATDDYRYNAYASKEPIPLLQAMDVAEQYYPARKRILAGANSSEEPSAAALDSLRSWERKQACARP